MFEIQLQKPDSPDLRPPTDSGRGHRVSPSLGSPTGSSDILFQQFNSFKKDKMIWFSATNRPVKHSFITLILSLKLRNNKAELSRSVIINNRPFSEDADRQLKKLTNLRWIYFVRRREIRAPYSLHYCSRLHQQHVESLWTLCDRFRQVGSNGKLKMFTCFRQV